MKFSKQDLELFTLTKEAFQYINNNLPLSRTQKKAFIALSLYYPISMTEEEIYQTMLLYKMEDIADIELDSWLNKLIKDIEELKMVRLN